MEQADAEDGTVIVVLMGVSGSGKTTVGRTLADDLGWTFLDADDFHPPANVAKMAAGVALSDEDRWPWLDRLVEELRAFEQNGRHVILACSALKQSYRDRLAPAGDVRWVYLKGEKSTIEPRIASRESHYMPASLLTSQFAALEEPAGAIVVDIRQSLDLQAAQIAASLRSKV